MRFINLHINLLAVNALEEEFLCRGKAKDQVQLEIIYSNKTHFAASRDQINAIQRVEQCVGVPPKADGPLSPETFFDKYQSYETIKASLEKWALQHHDKATFVPSIGKTHEGRDIFAFKIATEHSTKRGLWFNGGLHAREWIAPATAVYLIHKLLEDCGSSRVNQLLDKFDFYFTPLGNPDGYEYSRLPNNRYWRKNRRDNGDGTFGVDLNRNWDVHWSTRARKIETHEIIYPGPYPHSEPEVQALANFSLSIPQRYGGLDLHAYGQYILRNWGFTLNNSTNEDTLVELSQLMKAAFQSNGYDYGILKPSEMYVDSGSLSDWMATKAQMVSLIIELCPSANSTDDFELPPIAIISCAESAYAAALAFSEYLMDHPNIPPNHPISDQTQ